MWHDQFVVILHKDWDTNTTSATGRKWKLKITVAVKKFFHSVHWITLLNFFKSPFLISIALPSAPQAILVSVSNVLSLDSVHLLHFYCAHTHTHVTLSTPHLFLSYFPQSTNVKILCVTLLSTSEKITWNRSSSNHPAMVNHAGNEYPSWENLFEMSIYFYNYLTVFVSIAVKCSVS